MGITCQNKQAEIDALFEEQYLNWPLLNANYKALQKCKTRFIYFEGFVFCIQFNPERVISTTSDIKTKIVTSENCFLCQSNLPPEQRFIPFEEEYLILCNPYPVFSKHLTIAAHKHIVQSIQGNVSTVLRLSKQLYNFIVFYNGAACGASAPQHLHFQAGIKNEFPLYKDLKSLKESYTKEYTKQTDTLIEVWEIKDGLRSFRIIEGENISDISSLIESGFQAEPNINLLVWYENNRWVVCLFERKKHRPDQYYATGEDQILVSPAAVEMSGLVITPRKEDFDKINETDLISIFSQI